MRGKPVLHTVGSDFSSVVKSAEGEIVVVTPVSRTGEQK